MSDPKSERRKRGKGDSASVALHIAEYEALMTRNSYVMTLQFSMLPAAVLVVTLFAQVWSEFEKQHHQEAFIWALYSSLLVVSIVWVETLWEIYNNVWYMERELKPRISYLCNSPTFWGYERHQARIRGTNPALGELTQPVVSVGVFIVAVYLTWPFNSTWPFEHWEYGAVLVAALMNYRLLSRSIDAIRLRRDFFDLERAPILPPAIVIVTTLVVGIFPLLCIAYLSKTLWLDSTVDSPLIAVPSVLIGDSLILPILNWRIVQFIVACLSIPISWRTLFTRLVLGFSCASLISAYATYKWTHDQYFGFIDPAFGKLSFAGWWHLGFTIAETTFIFVFLLLWVHVASSRRTGDVLRLATTAWNAFLPYALLSLADFLVLHFYLLPRRAVSDYTPFTAWEGLLVIPFWIVVKCYLIHQKSVIGGGSVVTRATDDSYTL